MTEAHEPKLAPSLRGEQSSSTVERHVEELLGGQAAYTVSEAAERSGLTDDEVLRFWRALGFPTVSNIAHERLFTDGDVAIMAKHAELLRSDNAAAGLSGESERALVRALSQTMDRLVLWQQEALVEYARTTLGLDSLAARFWLLDHIGDYTPFLADEMEYAWRRHLAALLRRTEVDSTHMPTEEAESLQLTRALGFIDMVSFTHRSNELGQGELLALIESFDRMCRDIITARGARVVKTIGDAFLYIADTIEIAADVTTSIVDALRRVDGMLPVHASVVWGGVISRFGDVFGPTVNLSSRLASAAPPNTVLTDEKTANIIHKLALPYSTVDLGRRNLAGIGETRLMELRRQAT